MVTAEEKTRLRRLLCGMSAVLDFVVKLSTFYIELDSDEWIKLSFCMMRLDVPGRKGPSLFLFVRSSQ